MVNSITVDSITLSINQQQQQEPASQLPQITQQQPHHTYKIRLKIEK